VTLLRFLTCHLDRLDDGLYSRTLVVQIHEYGVGLCHPAMFFVYKGDPRLAFSETFVVTQLELNRTRSPRDTPASAKIAHDSLLQGDLYKLLSCGVHLRVLGVRVYFFVLFFVGRAFVQPLR
jgi:hypothetical protein